jgi:Helix-turn-helix domain
MDDLRPMLMTVDAVVRELSISRAGVYRLISAGALESVHVFSSIRITSASVESFVSSLVEGGRNQNAAPSVQPLDVAA